MSDALALFRSLPADGRLLIGTRITRLFAYGALSVVLVLYLVQLGMSLPAVGVLLCLTLVGDTLISLWITTSADRIGRRSMLILGAILMLIAGIAFAVTRNAAILLIAAIVGVISPSGNEVGPFLAVEQASLSHIIDDGQRTRVFAWYNLVGSFATAFGALCAGLLTQALLRHGSDAAVSYRAVVIAYAAIGLLLAFMFARLSPNVEVNANGGDNELPRRAWLGLHRSRSVILRLSGLFSLDAFAGGFVIQSFIAYWFHVRYGVSPGLIGSIMFGANLLAGVSALYAVAIAARIGLVNTMVYTHIPSNILLILVPLMPNLSLSICMLLLRFSISQMDVPARQSLTMALVRPDERSAAAGVTGTARTVGAAISPLIAGPLLAHAALLGVPFFVAGGLKIVYDLLLYKGFQSSQHHGKGDQGHNRIG